jgi:hypothetical protein
MERYIGIDTHRDSSTICVLSAGGKPVEREERLIPRHTLAAVISVDLPAGLG